MLRVWTRALFPPRALRPHSLDMLMNQQENQHASKLEWIIIVLICIEVAIEVVWNILLRDVFQVVKPDAC